MPQAYFTFAKQIFHIEDISLVPEERISLKKTLATASAFFWWERVDSNHRSESQQIYSLPPLATRELSHILCSVELVDGFEPPTC